MDQQGESFNFLLKGHKLQNKAFDAWPEDNDASF